MYYPHRCDLYVATDGHTDYDLDALVAKIDAMPAPLLEKDWAGELSPSWETFSILALYTVALDQREAEEALNRTGGFPWQAQRRKVRTRPRIPHP